MSILPPPVPRPKAQGHVTLGHAPCGAAPAAAPSPARHQYLEEGQRVVLQDGFGRSDDCGEKASLSLTPHPTLRLSVPRLAPCPHSRERQARRHRGSPGHSWDARKTPLPTAPATSLQPRNLWRGGRPEAQLPVGPSLRHLDALRGGLVSPQLLGPGGQARSRGCTGIGAGLGPP